MSVFSTFTIRASGNRAAFFSGWRSAVKAVDPEVYLVGEIWERDPSWLRGDQFDALMNYALGQAIVEPFARGDIPASRVHDELASLVVPRVEGLSASEVELRFRRPQRSEIASQVDGEQWTSGQHFRLTVLARALPIITPADFVPPWR